MKDLNIEINEILKEFSNDFVENLNLVAAYVSKQAVSKLKSTSPNNNGDYAKGWKVKRVKNINAPDTFTVHNSTNYQLTHLLEYGHANRGGGRTKTYPHIASVEEFVQKEVIKELTK